MTDPEAVDAIERELATLVEAGAVRFYRPSNPRGECFAVGVLDDILHMDISQALCFISGAMAVTTTLMAILEGTSPS